MKKENKIRILIVDDHFIVRRGLSESLKRERDMTVIGEASTGQQAIDVYREHRPDIVLMDLRLPGMSGAEAAAAICGEFKHAGVIMLTTFDGDEDIRRALLAGARGYLLKSILRDELLMAIRAVHSGERYFPTEISIRLAESVSRLELTARELEILRLIVKGKSNKEIATDLSVAEGTIKNHIGHLLCKLQVADRTQAVTAAIRRGLVHLD
jgi:two-component system, NarL family, response regulator